MISLKDPEGNERKFDPSGIVLVFYSKFLSPPKAKGNVAYGGQIRSLLAKPEEIVAAIGDGAKLIRLTLPQGGLASAKGPIWINVAMIAEVRQSKAGAIVKMSPQRGVVQVTESKQQVDDLIGAAG
jgi:hypothetical protein